MPKSGEKPAKNRGGRPPFVPNPDQKALVRMLSGFGIPLDEICLALGNVEIGGQKKHVTAKTLRRACKAELAAGKSQVQTQLITNMMKLARGTDGTALRACEFLLRCRFGWSQYAAPPPPSTYTPKPAKLGKKAQENRAAYQSSEDPEWGELLRNPAKLPN